MNEDYKTTVKKVFNEIGVKEGQKLIDFGCGSGYYTLPAAQFVGEEGIVYAVDKDESKLDELKERARDLDLANIEIVDSPGGTDLDFPDESMDVVLLYDVFWYFDLSSQELGDLLEEMYRLSKPAGLLSVYPKHIDSTELKDRIQLAGFSFQGRYSGTLLHEGSPERGTLLDFTKI